MWMFVIKRFSHRNVQQKSYFQSANKYLLQNVPDCTSCSFSKCIWSIYPPPFCKGPGWYCKTRLGSPKMVDFVFKACLAVSWWVSCDWCLAETPGGLGGCKAAVVLLAFLPLTLPREFSGVCHQWDLGWRQCVVWRMWHCVLPSIPVAWEPGSGCQTFSCCPLLVSRCRQKIQQALTFLLETLSLANPNSLSL